MTYQLSSNDPNKIFQFCNDSCESLSSNYIECEKKDMTTYWLYTVLTVSQKSVNSQSKVS